MPEANLDTKAIMTYKAHAALDPIQCCCLYAPLLLNTCKALSAIVLFLTLPSPIQNFLFQQSLKAIFFI